MRLLAASGRITNLISWIFLLPILVSASMGSGFIPSIASYWSLPR